MIIKIIKSIFAFFLAFVVLSVLNYLLPQVTVLSSWWFIAIVIAIFNFLVVFLTTPSTLIRKVKVVREEHLMSGHGQIKEVFQLDLYENMEELESTEAGRSFVSESGEIVTTAYVNKEKLLSEQKSETIKIVHLVFTVFLLTVIVYDFCSHCGYQLSDVGTFEAAGSHYVESLKEVVEKCKVNADMLTSGGTQVKIIIQKNIEMLKNAALQAAERFTANGISSKEWVIGVAAVAAEKMRTLLQIFD